MSSYDAILVVSFGGPEQPEDVMPFLENVTRGRGIPPERLTEVAAHYNHFGGRSPINDQNRELIACLREELADFGPNLPIYWGNRNWHPFLTDTVAQMKSDGIRHALAFVTSAFSSYSGCRQYKDNIAAACAEAGEGAPQIEKLRAFFNHPAYLEVLREETWDAIRSLPTELRDDAFLLFTAHSIPMSMANTSPYVSQLEFTSRSIAAMFPPNRYKLVFQSRSGSPHVPWLEPDVLDEIRARHADGVRSLVIIPIGFVSDHLEVLYDLDTEASKLCDELGIIMARAATAGTHPYFVRMIRELIIEHMEGKGAIPGLCGPECCPVPARPPGR